GQSHLLATCSLKLVAYINGSLGGDQCADAVEVKLTLRASDWSGTPQQLGSWVRARSIAESLPTAPQRQCIGRQARP
ncbi:MAG TPA: hypothetical protein VGD40_15020, partial [Chryseosolibacter sp.]